LFATDGLVTVIAVTKAVTFSVQDLRGPPSVGIDDHLVELLEHAGLRSAGATACASR